MMLTIAIIAGIFTVLSFGSFFQNGEFDIEICPSLILILSCWNLCLPISIITIVLVCLIGLVSLI